jgi:peptidyl-prolyl cis-trans isomerase A (cyclophilin A)
MKNSVRWIAVIALVAAGCEHKSQRDDQRGSAMASGSNAGVAPKPTGDEMKPEPVGREPEPPKPLPAPEQAVRPPTAEDLAEYTKDLPGSGDKLHATIETSMGTLHCDLYPDKAPMTVANFIGLATGKKAWLDPNSGSIQKGKPYFDGTTCHRVIAGFMMQCGDPTGSGGGGPGYQFANEFVTDLKMDPGTLAMANADDPRIGRFNTNGSQFFVMEGARPDLVGHHTIFGKCKELDVVKTVTHTPTTDDKPNTPVTINKVTISK